MYKKHSRLLLLILPALIFLQCAAGKNKPSYNFPADYSAEKKKEAKIRADQGQILYKEHCSECHGIFTGGKKDVPNFTAIQIDNYSARFLRHDPKNHAITQKMSPDQMTDILMFLRYRNIKYPAN